MATWKPETPTRIKLAAPAQAEADREGHRVEVPWGLLGIAMVVVMKHI
jgi:hypothetical protein